MKQETVLNLMVVMLILNVEPVWQAQNCYKAEECSHKKTSMETMPGSALWFICIKPYEVYCIAVILLLRNSVALSSRKLRDIFMIWAGRCSLCHVVNAESRLIFSQQASALSSGNKSMLFMHGFLRKILSTLSQAIYPNILEWHEMNMSCLIH